jgi:hypothetical protein
VLGEHDDRGRSDKTPIRGQGIEIQWNIPERGGQDAARSTPRKIAVELVSRQHAAAVFIDQLAHSDACRGQMDTGFAYPPADREEAQAPAAGQAQS